MSETEHPKGEPAHPIYRTSPERTVKMMVIVLGICIVGGVIFFGMWDYWISSLSPAGIARAGVSEAVAPVAQTGIDIPVSLSFIESSDFRTLAFNALPGEPDNNPSIQAEVGDRIIFDIINDGKSFHAFGVTAADEGFGGIIPGSDVASGSKPLKPGEGGTSEFIPGEEGVYYYICTVPGHRLQGMVGQIIVGDVSAPAETQVMEPEPELMMEEPMMEEPTEMGPFSGTISLPTGSSVPGCDETSECFIPAQVSISVGETVTWSNDDTAAHTVTSGLPAEGPDGNFDSSLFMAGTTFDHTFDEAGEYDYFCMVHPWMIGKVSVN